MANTFRDELLRRLATSPGLGTGGPVPTAADVRTGIPGGANQIAALSRPNQVDPLGLSHQAPQMAAAQELWAQYQRRRAIQAATRNVAPPIDYGGGGGPVTANDILGQRGPVVLNPTYAALKTAAESGVHENRMRGMPDGSQSPDYAPYVPNVRAEQEKINQVAADMTATDPLVSAATGIVKNPKGSLFTLLDYLDKPRQWSAANIGDAAYRMATNQGPPEWLRGTPYIDQIWGEIASGLDDQERQAIIAAHNSGGGASVWENVIAAATDNSPWYVKYPIRGLTDIVIDPTGYPLMVATGFGGALKSGAVRSAAEGQVARAAIEDVLGKAASAPQAIMDATVDAPFNFIAEKGGNLIRRMGGGKLLDEAPRDRATEQVNQAESAFKTYDNLPRTEDGGGPMPNPQGPDTPPSSPGRYTMAVETINGEEVNVIRDPQGVVVEELPYQKQTGLEPPRVNRDAQRTLDAYNFPIDTAEGQAAGAVFPESNLGWADPRYNRTTNAGRDRPMTLGEKATYDVSIPQEQRQAFWKDAEPALQEHVRVMNEIRAKEMSADFGQGMSYEKDLVQKGMQRHTPEKVFEEVRLMAEDLIPAWRKHIPEKAPPPYKMRYQDRKSTASLIEQAVFGTREEAIAARKAIRQQGIKIEGVDNLGDRLSQMAKDVNGEGFLSTDPRAVYARQYRDRMANAPIPNEAAVSEIAPVPDANAVPVVQQATDPAIVQGRDVTLPESPLPAPQKTPAGRPVKQTMPWDDTLDDDMARRMLRGNVTWEKQTPLEKGVHVSRIQSGQAGSVIVKPSGKGSRSMDEMVLLPRTERDGTTIWEIHRNAMVGEKIDELATLNDAIALADELLLLQRKGLNVDPAAAKKAKDALGIINRVDPALEERVRQGILRDAGALNGPGDTAYLSRGDTSPVGLAHQIGKIDSDTYRFLTRQIEYRGESMPLWQAYDMAVLDMGGDVERARKAMAELAVDPETRAAITPKEKGALGRKTNGMLRKYETYLRMYRENKMFNWARGFAGIVADSVGNAYTLAINGEGDAVRRASNLRTAGTWLADEQGKQVVREALPEWKRITAVTGKEPPHSVTQLVETRFETGSKNLVLEDKLGKAYTRTPLRALADPLIRDVRVSMDRNFRYALFASAFDQRYADDLIRFDGIVRERAARLGADAEPWLAGIKEMGDHLTPDDVLRVTGDARLARDWRELASKNYRDAAKRVDKLLFSFKNTGADNLLRHVVLFHYWVSRAFVLHAHTALRNPYLLNAYIRAYEAMQREAEEAGYPANVKGFIRFMGSEAGMYGLINPVNVLTPFSMLIEGNDDPGTMAFLKRWGFFFNPVVEMAGAVLGMSKETPDLLGDRAIRRAARAVTNWLNANGYEGLVPDVLGDANTWQASKVDQLTTNVIRLMNRGAVSFANLMGGDQQLVKEFTGSDANAGEYDTITSILLDQMEAKFGPKEQWTDQTWDTYLSAFDDIMLGRDGNEYADAAVEYYADARLDATIANTLTPGGIYQRYGPRDAQLAGNAAGDQAASDNRDLATAGSPQDAELTALQIQFDQMGTEDQKNLYAGYNQILNFDNPQPDQYLVIDGQWISGYEIARMSDSEREALAKRWLATFPNGEQDYTVYDKKRGEFLAQHPAYGDFKEYQKQVYRYDGGVRAWRTTYAKKDSQFAKALKEHEDYLRGQGKTGDVLEAELDQWAAGMAGYKAASGFRDNAYDQPMNETTQDFGFPEASATGKQSPGGGSSTPKSTPEKIRDRITRYYDELDVATMELAGAGYDASVIHHPYYGASLPVSVPDMPDEVYFYEQWKAKQPPGMNTSVDAYIAYLESLSYQKAA